MQGHPEGAELEAYDDSEWVTLDLPHDYSITQPVTNGQVGIGNHNAGQNGYMPGWMVWYRKWVDMECLAGKRYLLQIDGSYRRTEVWVNEQFVGTQPNGYFSFALDVTEALAAGPATSLPSGSTTWIRPTAAGTPARASTGTCGCWRCKSSVLPTGASR